MKTGSGRGGPRQDGAASARTEAPRRFRRALWVSVGVATLACLALAFGLRAPAGPAGRSGVASSAAPADLVGGPFHLLDQDGHAVDQRLLDGKWSAVFFGYTSCPDVCPATLTTLGAAQDRLGAAAARFQVVLITIDPERDRAPEMKVYVSQPGFPKGTIGLTGTPQQVADVARAYHAFYRKRPIAGGAYEMDHSAFIYLMDPRGRFVRTLAEQEGPDAIAAAVKEAMAAR